MLRVLINDTEAPQTYSDARLQQIIVVAGQYVQQEISFTTTYTIDIGTPDISPDPTVTATKDDEFTNFTVLKAACMTDWSTFRQKALLAGVRARCGPVLLETLKHLDGFSTLLEEGPCAAYEELKKDYQFGNTNVVRAILSPFRGNNFDPESLRAVRTDGRI
jgi:hypothetical protein